MTGSKYLRNLVVGVALVIGTTTASFAASFDVPGGDLDAALETYIAQSGVQLLVPNAAVHGVRTQGAKGNLTDGEALARILKGTGFVARTDSSGVIGIAHETPHADAELPLQLAQAAPASRAAVETVTVTSSKLGGADVQSIPISITALSQEQLTATQTAGGPDLIKEVPNMTFTKTNFSGYNIEIRGIGTQAISVTTDPAVAVAFNDIPFIRNHFFEQEFYDVAQVEVLRGPQGTLYGRNATAGVVNLISAKPTDQFEAMASADLGNYHNRRFEGMINLPIVDDRVDIRVAGEWTKREGYTENTTLNAPIDGRDLWSGRMTLGWKPASNVQAYLVWEHFSEDDDRLRSGKQLCKTAPSFEGFAGGNYGAVGNYLSQGCEDTSLYSPSAFEVPNGYSLAYYAPLADAGAPTIEGFNAYAETTQSTNLRDIQSTINPTYRAKNDTLELNVDYQVTPPLTFTSQTGFNHDFLWSSEDYDRFDSTPGAFVLGSETLPDPSDLHVCQGTGYPGTCQNLPVGAPCTPNPSGDYSCGLVGVFCDPQLGCSDRLVAQDLSDEHAWQLSQEFRLASSFSGPFNFSAGANYLHYETEENYYVFINSLTSLAASNHLLPWIPGVSDNSQCLSGGLKTVNPSNNGSIFSCEYIDPNPISSLNNEGHNYFLSQNPYTLNSYAGFGEAYYNVTKDLKLTAGARWTDDQKHFVDIPSELLDPGYGYPITGVVNQQWDQWTGRFVADWTPHLDFTDQTLIYASAAHGYKAGGANPPGAFFPTDVLGEGTGVVFNPIHPLTFKPEFIEAFELGTKNTLLDGTLMLNGDVFYYNYTGYQVSEIVDRTAINNNYNAHVEGGEIESNWEPLPGLKFSLAQGFENTALAGSDQGIDLMDRTAGNPDWVVVKPYVTTASNCILPIYVVNAIVNVGGPHNGGGRAPFYSACSFTYGLQGDPVTGFPYVPNPTVTSDGVPIPAGYPGFNPVGPTLGVFNAAPPNNGEGFDKKLGGNQLPGAPHFTTSLTAEYTMPVTDDWAVTLHADFYWQAQQWARVFEDSIDNIHGYSTTNLSLVFTNQNGWQAMAYVKNVFNVTAITGTFLNSDDTGLTTNVFLTDPRLIGIRVTKNW